MHRLEAARLAWRNGQPFATDFNDIYHAPDGIAEVNRVFLGPGGFEGLLSAPGPLLMGELGFGTGLNFAVAAEACIHAGKRLHFVSFDCAPLADADFQRLAAQRQSQLPIYAELARAYPPLLPGWHRRTLAEGLVTLSTFWGTADEGIDQLLNEQQRPFALWLLDGFAPDRNPDLWTPQLMQNLAALSQEGTTVATFTAAGRVRRALNDAGFTMRRVDQRPHKRESLAGYLDTRARGAGSVGLPLWHPPDRVRILGAGLAGASLARHLADAGVSVRVIDPRGVAGGASAVPTMVMHGRLLADQHPEGLFRAHAYLYARDYCRRFESAGAVRRCSALQVPSANYPAARLAAVADVYAGSGNWLSLVSAAEASAESGLPVTDPLLRFNEAAVVSAPDLCRELLNHPQIELTTATQTPTDPDETLVLACGKACQSFAQATYLELAAVGGQIDLFRANDPALAELGVAMVGNGYLARSPAGIVAGASYEYQPWPEARASEVNRGYLNGFAGELAADASWQARFRGERCVSSDRLPVAGMLTDAAGSPLAGRYVSTAHGSMGTVSAHVSAALIASQLLGDFAPLTPPLRELIAPQRFRIRQAKRGYRFSARG